MIEIYEQALAELFVTNMRQSAEIYALKQIIAEDVEKEAAEDAADGESFETVAPEGPTN